MNDRQKLINLGKEIGKSLKASDKIDIMLIMGGLAEGFADKHSDVDTVCYCNQELTFEELQNLLQDLDYEISWVDKKGSLRVDLIYDGRKITLTFSNTSSLKESMDKIESMDPRNYSKQRFMYNFVGNAIIVFDKLDIIEKNQKMVKETALEKFKKFTLHNLPDKLKYHFFKNGGAINVERERNNLLYISHIFTDSLKQIYKILYALNDEFLTNEKWVYRYLASFELKPDDSVRRLKKMATMETKKETLDRKIKLFRDFIRDLKQVMKGENIENLPEFKVNS